jgi:hypothetical protein
MRVAVINSSYYGMKPADRIYNLAVDKIANYHRSRGDEVYAGRWEPLLHQVDKYYFSVIFTWDIPALIGMVNLVKARAQEEGVEPPEIEIGGPAATFLHNYIHSRTGLEPHIGLDSRFEFVPGQYKMTFTSRGCPHNCRFCGVNRLEPVSIEYNDFPLARMIGDNNITATSWAHQLQVVNKLVNIRGKVDINSGFDVRFFRTEHLKLYSRLNLLQWRFAFDSLDVWEDVWRVATMMRAAGYDRHKVIFYCLIGFPGTSPEENLFRLETIRDFGLNPYPMRFIPLNSLSHRYVAPGFTEDILFRMNTYFQTPNIWMADTWENFRPSKRAYKVHEAQSSFTGGHDGQ